MLTIKNKAGSSAFLFLIMAGLLAGCMPPGPRALLEGKRLLEKGQYERAAEEFKAATTLLKTNTQTAQAWNYLGLAYHHAGKLDEADHAYQRALQADRDLTEAHFNLGCLWLEQNKLDPARFEFTTCTLRRGNWVEALVKLGTIQLRLRDLGAAEKSFGEALRLSPQDAEALNGMGLIRLQRGRPADAAAYFNSALKQNPDYPPALLNLAIVSQQYLRDRPLALQKYRQYAALKPAPANADAVVAVARQLDQELNPGSRPALSPPSEPVETNAPPAAPKAAVTNTSPNVAKSLPAPKPPPATNTAKSPMAATIVPRPAAAAAPTTAVETVRLPSEPAVKTPRDVPNVSPGKGTPSPASNPSIPAAKPASGRYAYSSPTKPGTGNRAEAQRAFEQGYQAQKAQQMSEAVQAYRRATQLDPSFFEAHYNLGLAAGASGNLPVALDAYAHALTIRPNSADARYNFALALWQANHSADAVTELQRLLAAHPNETRAHLALANLCAKQLQQPAQARAHYLKVLEIDPHIPQAEAIREWLAEHPK